MPNRRKRRFGPCECSVLALCAAIAAAAPASAERIGVASAVVPQAQGARPNAQPVVLRVGKDMVVDERVTTSAEGRAQLLFVDGSALMVGPNSDLVLDSYVFNPDADRGEATFSAARGVFRLVGGKLTKSSPVTIHTPSATVGVRGGIALIEVSGETTSATFLFGDRMTVTSGGVTKVVERPGYTVTADGAQPTDPAPAQPDQLAGKLASLEGSGEVQAVDDVSLTDEDVAERQISIPGKIAESDREERPTPREAMRASLTTRLAEPRAVSLAQRVVADAAGLGGESPAAACPGVCVYGLAGRGLRAGGDDAPIAGGAVGGGRFTGGGYDLFAPASPGEFPVQVGQASTPFGPAAGSGSLDAEGFVLYKLVGADGTRQLAFAGRPLNALPSGGVEAFELDEDFLRKSDAPFIDSVGLAAPGKAFIAWDASAPGAQRAFAGGSIVIHGQGAAQKSGAFALYGSVRTDAAGRPFIAGRMEGWARFAPTGEATRYASDVSSVDAGDGSDFFGAEGGRRFLLESARSGPLDEPLGGAVARSVGQTTSSFRSYTAAAPAAYSPAARSTRTLNGFLSGVERFMASGDAGYVRTINGDPAASSIVTDAARNVVSADFMLATHPGTATLQLGFGEAAPGGDSAFVDDATFVAAASEFRYNGAAIDGRGALATSAFLTHDGLLPAGVDFCDCRYLVWGFVGADRRVSATAPATQRATLEMATFVAGELSETTQLVGLPSLSATYQGHLVAGVAKGTGAATQTYTAVGAVTLAFSFGGGSYALDSVSISNFDGANLTGSGGAAASAQNRYSSAGMTVSGVHPTAGAISGVLEGAFFGPGSPPANTGGQARISGAGYAAAGTYAAARTN